MKNNDKLNKNIVKVFSKDFEEMRENLDPLDAYKLSYKYWYEQSFYVQGVERKIKIYIPSTATHCDYSIFVAVPSGEDAVTFLTESGWVDIAEKYHKYLVVFEPLGKEWRKKKEAYEIEYMATGFNLTNDRTLYNLYTGCYYFVGYGDGGQLLQQYIMSNPKICSGLVVFDGSDISKEYMEEIGAKPYVEPGVVLADVDVPVWVVNEEITENVENLIDYWKFANSSEEKALMLGSTEVYLQKPITQTSTIYKQAVSELRVTKQKSDYRDKAFNEGVWTNFLTKRSRFTSLVYGTGLRASYTNEEAGIKKHEMIVDGRKRYWHEFVPSIAKKDPSYKMPIVVAFHGSNQNSDTLTVYTEWQKLAEERGFMVLFPTAYPNLDQGGIPKPLWNASGDSNDTDDIKFIKEMLEDVESRHNINKGKIYANGQSLGCGMAHHVGLMLPDLFTAIGGTSAPILKLNRDGGLDMFIGLTDKSYTFPVGMKTDYEIPVMLTMGEHDIPEFFRNGRTSATVAYWAKRNGADLENPDTYKTGIFNNMVFKNKDGVPMVIYTLTDGRGHSCLPTESRIIWDEFFSKFTRRDGKIEYMKDEII